MFFYSYLPPQNMTVHIWGMYSTARAEWASQHQHVEATFANDLVAQVTVQA